MNIKIIGKISFNKRFISIILFTPSNKNTPINNTNKLLN